MGKEFRASLAILDEGFAKEIMKQMKTEDNTVAQRRQCICQKIKIYELAKELDKPSKELVEFLNKKDVEAKTHMSTIDEAEADMVRKAFAPKANAEKAEEEKI